jgi:DNA mismatch repair protein MutS
MKSRAQGIASLKVRFNSVFGYYIEITKSNLDKVPPHYIRKQTIANGERFITPELKAMEGKILGAEERSVKLEYEFSSACVKRCSAGCRRFNSRRRPWRNWTCWRRLLKRRGCTIIAGRKWAMTRRPDHSRRPASRFWNSNWSRSGLCPTTPALTAKMQIALITGPNMAGKSTFIRQVALLTLLAHTGSFMPAAAARIDLVDRIFTRIGASDDLSRGQSTFMVEMTETANILNNATARSLIVLDEIGRGTSTFDGLSLAWSIVEYLHNQARGQNAVRHALP